MPFLSLLALFDQSYETEDGNPMRRKSFEPRILRDGIPTTLRDGSPYGPTRRESPGVEAVKALPEATAEAIRWRCCWRETTVSNHAATCICSVPGSRLGIIIHAMPCNLAKRALSRMGGVSLNLHSPLHVFEMHGFLTGRGSAR